MTLRRRLILICLAIAVVAAYVPYKATEWLRERDMTLAVQRFAASQMTDDVRARCENYPGWFLAGPRENQPTAAERAVPDADVFVKRPNPAPLPFEYFAYDTEFSPTSTAGPSFPREFKNKLKASNEPVTAPWTSPSGTGVQVVRATGWAPSCAYVLFRLRPNPNLTTERWTLYGSMVVLIFAAAVLASFPVAGRVRKLAHAARESARAEYAAMAPVKTRDEIAALAHDFNEAGADIRRRQVDVKDREETLRRLMANTTDEVAKPLAAIAGRLGMIENSGQLSADDRARVQQALRDTHELSAHLHDLMAAATLRMTIQSQATDVVDLTAIVSSVVSRFEPFARGAGVTIAPHIPNAPVTIDGSTALVEQAISNLVDNAIRHNRAGGRADVTLERAGDRQFVLRVRDNGPGVPEEHLQKLNGIARFRGDEGRSGRPGQLGLGLAIVREVGDRFGIKWAFRNVPSGGFEAELSGATR